MPMGTTTAGTIVVSKAIVVGGLSTAIMSLLTNSETMSLLMFGSFTSCLSFFYDWAKTHPREFTINEVAELSRMLFYGIGLMFITFYGAIELSDGRIDLPKIVWGIIAAFVAGSATKVVDYLFAKIKTLADTIFNKLNQYVNNFKGGKK